jgi:hypothetical protein
VGLNLARNKRKKEFNHLIQLERNFIFVPKNKLETYVRKKEEFNNLDPLPKEFLYLFAKSLMKSEAYFYTVTRTFLEITFHFCRVTLFDVT